MLVNDTHRPVYRTEVRFSLKFPILAVALWCALVPMTARAQDQNEKCFVLCAPDLKIEPTFTWENLAKAPRIAETDDQGDTVVQKAARERSFETVIAVGVPTTIPRSSFTFEVIVKPFVKGASPELETELNLHWLRSEDTGGWVSSHFDIIDKYSPGGRRQCGPLYT